MRTSLLPLFALSTLLPAQASFVPFGTGCSFLSQTLAIGNQGLPRIGTTFQITYSGPNFTFNSAQQIAMPHLVLGFGPLFTPIPQSLLPQQPAGCAGFITPNAVIPAQPDPVLNVFQSAIPIMVPNNPMLIGFALHAQWLLRFDQCGFAGCNWAAVPTSDAAMATVGL